MRFSVEVMAILVAAATSHFVAIQGKLIFVISMKSNRVKQFQIQTYIMIFFFLRIIKVLTSINMITTIP